jgi:putative ABC transport system permease protein
MLQNLRISVRRLARRPAFTLAAVGTLAVGVGATTAIFSTVNATLLRPLPHPHPEELYALHTRFVDGRYTSGRDRLGGGHIREVNERAHSVKLAAAYTVGDVVLMVEGGLPRDLMAARVSEGFFDIFETPMALGRGFVDEDYRSVQREVTALSATGQTQTIIASSPAAVAVVSHRLWEQVFAGDSALVDNTIRLRGQTLTVLGIAPPGFDVPPGTDLWLPSPLPGGQTITLTGGYLRTQPGVTREALATELDAVALGMLDRFPMYEGRTFATIPLNESIVGDLGPILLIVLAGAILLLVLGCVNVATLLLARATGQTKELAVRAALGADRSRILGQIMTESFLLAAGGTLLGLGLAYAGIRLLLAYGGAELPRLDSVPFDARVLLFTAVVLLLATLLVGALPALRLSTPNLRELLSESGRSATGGRRSRHLLGGLVIAEISLAIMLVAGAGWLVRSYTNLSRIELGFVPQGRLLVDPLLPETPTIMQAWQTQAPERLRALGPVTAIGTGQLPLSRFTATGYYIGVPGEEFDPNRPGVGYIMTISPEYFDALGARLLAGRMLSNEDRPPLLVGRTNPQTGLPETGYLDPVTGAFTPSTAVSVSQIQNVVVNQAFVDRFLAHRRDDPVGAVFAYGAPTVNFRTLREVVGVVETIQYRDLQGDGVPVWYTLGNLGARNWIVATSAVDPTSLIPSIRATLSEIDPSAHFTVEPLETLVSAATWRHRLGLLLMVLFAAISLALSAIGIFGVIADATAQRTRELATRLALGASPANVVGVLLRQGRMLSIGGVGAGVLAAYAGGRLAASRLHQVSASDPAVLAIAVAAVLAVTLVAFLLPALRAARIAPAEALKGE